ncbi:hypothetical protein CIG1485E_a0002 (plasmid) [Campylobacter iguaniorum]|uniref:Uncharacterized protein n=1 Tax=Campylobacter iguaniorum TaxID=1244531 RepID=A0A076FDQ2_9BACT|nr:hypothetical protein [Campylobacter iguaniorum]AII15527.1 hypothetical protein CIG1485E_a0002 [Campylobacter iguaniorum]
MKLSNFLLMIVYSLAISGLVVFAYDKYKVQDQIPKFYMIDSQLIVEQKKNELKEMIFKQGQQPTEDAIVDYLTNIDKIVEYISKRDNAIIVVKTAVASKNVKDITREVLQIYAKEVSGKSIN